MNLILLKLNCIYQIIYTEPEILIDATSATFLISENVPSPMGAFLSAFKNKADAEKYSNLIKAGELYNWTNSY